MSTSHTKCRGQLAACEGAILVVDAAQGVEAQTLANVNLAMNSKLAIVPVINKIDLPAAEPDRVAEEIEEVLAIDATEAIRASAKEGIGTQEILEAVVRTVPPPHGDPDKPLRALVFDSHFDAYLGVVAYVRVIDGHVEPGTQIKMMATGKVFEVTGVGIFQPRMNAIEKLQHGRSRVYHGQRQDSRRVPRGRHGDAGARRGDRSPAGLPSGEARRLLRPVSDRQQPVSGAEGSAGQTADERCGPDF